jgi:hypothetical protein
LRFSQSRSSITANPRFALTTLSRPRLQRGQMTIVFERLESAHPDGLTLEELVKECRKQEYDLTFRNPNTDIRKSILYHLNRLESVRKV